jgi:hypothetical protein
MNLAVVVVLVLQVAMVYQVLLVVLVVQECAALLQAQECFMRGVVEAGRLPLLALVV